MTAPRNPDGSIPENDFLKLSPNSKAIDKGVDVNMPYEGYTPTHCQDRNGELWG
ncbi:MAG: hypothetical protein WBC22_19675 [Sedimentisphaerales bacterium]